MMMVMMTRSISCVCSRSLLSKRSVGITTTFTGHRSFSTRTFPDTTVAASSSDTQSEVAEAAADIDSSLTFYPIIRNRKRPAIDPTASSVDHDVSLTFYPAVGTSSRAPPCSDLRLWAKTTTTTT
eukprot:scaffold21309_cov105-Amphora_coffeaeformis.AAC.1